MSESQGGANGPRFQTSQAPEGKLIQIGGRQIRRQYARALRAQGNQSLAPAPEPMLPEPAPASPPPEPTPLPQRSTSTRRKRRRSLPQILAFLVLAVLPALIGLAYYGSLATDQYVAVSQFAIRAQTPVGTDSTSSSTILGGGLANLGDTQIVTQYIHSDQLLRDIEDDVDIRALYSVEKADWWARLDPTVSREKLLRYWQWMSTVEMDPLSGIVTLSIRGFAPEDAKRVSEAVLAESEKLVNNISERARRDAMKLADAEVQKAKLRVDETFNALKAFQEREKQLNPTELVVASGARIAKLESDLTSYETQFASLRKTMAANAPSVVYVRNQIDSIKAQLDAERAKATDDTNAIHVPALTAQFEKLKLDQEFAEKAYLSTLESQGAARVEANRQVRYLEAFVRPRLPETSLYPNRPLMMLLSIGFGAFLWLMSLLIVATIKEHL